MLGFVDYARLHASIREILLLPLLARTYAFMASHLNDDAIFSLANDACRASTEYLNHLHVPHYTGTLASTH